MISYYTTAVISTMKVVRLLNKLAYVIITKLNYFVLHDCGNMDQESRPTLKLAWICNYNQIK